MKIRGRAALNVGLLLSLLFALGSIVGWADPFGTFFTLEGTLTSNYDFGIDQITGESIGSVPATVLIQEFVIPPGISTGWHYHRGLSYVVLLKGTIQQQQADGCTTTIDHPGSAFIEEPYAVHNVKNTGPEAAVLAWATIFPKADFPKGDYLGGMYLDPNPVSCH